MRYEPTLGLTRELVLDQIKIRQFKKEDYPTIVELYKEAFSDILGNKTDFTILFSKRYYHPQTTFIADLEGRVVGYGVIEKLNQEKVEETRKKLRVKNKFEAKNLSSDLEYQIKRRSFGEIKQIQVEIFNEDITKAMRGEKYNPTTNDIILRELVVHQDFRRLSIGKKLANTRIEAARKLAANAVFVNTVEGRGSEQLYQKLGFFRISRTTPSFYDGTASTKMGYLLR